MNVKIKYNHWYPKLIKAEAITLYPYILSSRHKEHTPNKTIRHEMEHVRQIRNNGWFKFYIVYLSEYFNGLFKHRCHYTAYSEIEFEKDARKSEEKDLTASEYNEIKKYLS